jgi:hypothetical protein
MTPSSVATFIGGLQSVSAGLVNRSSVQPMSAPPQGQRKIPPSCNTCPPPSLQTIYAPTIGLAEIANGRIVFNSRAGAVTEVQPTFYTEEGVAVSGPAIQLQPAEIRYVDIAALLPRDQRWRVRWGGMSLSYTGKLLDI